MKRTIPIILVVIALGIASGYYINHKLKISKLNENLQRALGTDQGLIETLLQVESESSNMSYKELFELCDKSVNDRTNLIVELRGLYPDMESQLKDSLIEFFSSENELVRSKSQSYRKRMNIGIDLDEYSDYVRDYNYSSYTYDIYKSHCDKLREDMQRDASEMLGDIESFRNNYNLLVTKEMSLVKLTGKEHLRFSPIFEKYKQSNFKYIDDTNAYCSEIIKKLHNS